MADVPANARRAAAAVAGDGEGSGETAPVAAAEQAAESKPIVDVWSRTSPKYRVRAILLLIVNMLLFCGLCVFTHWLHTANLFTFTWDSYAAPGRFWDNTTPNLNDFILYPISVERTPIHGVVLGLLVASIVAIPIVISILYRFGYAIPFIASVLIFAHMPWMAVTLLLSCVLASVRPFRMTFRFGSALVGMLPVILYLYLATRGDGDELGAVASPAQRAALTAPWALALLAACAMMAVILLIARMVNYRPGAVAPVVAVMFVTPVVIFHVYVGVDEVVYRVLETQYGPQAPRFAPVEDASDRILSLVHTWTDEDVAEHLRRGALRAAWGGEVSEFKRLIARNLTMEYLADRAAAYEACRAFLADHLRSRYEPNVLYLQGRILDTRLDERRLVQPQPQTPPRRELYSDFPHAQSFESWSALLAKYPESPLATAASLRLAQLRLRAGEIDAALELLDRELARAAVRNTTTRPGSAGWLRGEAPEASLRYDPQPDRREARRLRELIRFNRDDLRYGATPLIALAGLDPHRPRYLEQLEHLAAAYGDSALYDDLVVTWAATLPDAKQRAAALEACVKHFKDGSAAAQALFLHADLELLAVEQGPERRAAGLARMREAATRFAGTYWGDAAAERLGMIETPLDATATGSVQR